MIFVDRKPTHHVQHCGVCEKPVEKGQIRAIVPPTGWKGRQTVFHIECLLRSVKTQKKSLE